VSLDDSPDAGIRTPRRSHTSRKAWTIRSGGAMILAHEHLTAVGPEANPSATTTES
jgi:hypothetical protein